MDLLIRRLGSVKSLFLLFSIYLYSYLFQNAHITFQVWQMVQKKLDCIEVVATKEPIQKLETYGQMIFMITQGQRIKVKSDRK